MTKIAQKISTQIASISEDSTFGYDQLGIPKEEYQTAAKAIERLLKKNTIKRISKGVFYKPKMTIFGELKPDSDEIIRPYLFTNGKRVAYITGTYLYNQLGLTTQMAFKMKIASRSKRIYINTTAIKATPVKSYAEVTDDNYEILGFLDAIKDIKKIPDTNIKTAVKIIQSKIKNLPKDKIQIMVKLALLYPPRVRALFGAMIENLAIEIKTEDLKDSINPLTHFKLGIKEEDLNSAINWNIL